MVQCTLRHVLAGSQGRLWLELRFSSLEFRWQLKASRQRWIDETDDLGQPISIDSQHMQPKGLVCIFTRALIDRRSGAVVGAGRDEPPTVGSLPTKHSPIGKD